eukprot:5083576-Pleurochrysis_carterae.AAC.1
MNSACCGGGEGAGAGREWLVQVGEAMNWVEDGLVKRRSILQLEKKVSKGSMTSKCWVSMLQSGSCLDARTVRVSGSSA